MTARLAPSVDLATSPVARRLLRFRIDVGGRIHRVPFDPASLVPGAVVEVANGRGATTRVTKYVVLSHYRATLGYIVVRHVHSKVARALDPLTIWQVQTP